MLTPNIQEVIAICLESSRTIPWSNKSVVFPKEIATFNDGIPFESSLDAISIVEAVKRQSIPGSITQVR